jgi:hypothetical protein
MALRIAPFIHGGSVFRTVIILLGIIVHDDAEKAEAFNTFFSSQSNIDDTDKSVPADDTPPPRCLDRIVFQLCFYPLFCGQG